MANAKRQSKVILAKRAAEQTKLPMGAAPAMTEAGTQVAKAMPHSIRGRSGADPGRQIYLDEAKLRMEAALGPTIGFTERLVWFGPTISASPPTRSEHVRPYEREAIRPQTCSARFADMLLAVEGHPAMLFYLDNLASMGASSIAGINRNRGLNENSRARDAGAAYARRARRLHPGRRHRPVERVHAAGPWCRRRQSRAWRRVQLQSATA